MKKEHPIKTTTGINWSNRKPTADDISGFLNKIPSKPRRIANKIINKVDWKWVVGTLLVLASLCLGYMALPTAKTKYDAISWKFNYDKKQHKGYIQGQFSGRYSLKMGTKIIPLPKSISTNTAACDMFDDGKKITLQSSMRENPKFPANVGERVTDGCSTAHIRKFSFVCCWEE
jgi:hypothetical protein